MIEITRGKSLVTYCINEHCPTELLARQNKRGARWYVLSVHKTAEEATAKLLTLERDTFASLSASTEEAGK